LLQKKRAEGKHEPFPRLFSTEARQGAVDEPQSI